MEQRISLITLGVRDLATSHHFYEQGLGWHPSSASNAQVAFFQTGGMVLALYGKTALAQGAHLPKEGTGFGGITLAYNVRHREEVDAVLAEAQAAGATLLKTRRGNRLGWVCGLFRRSRWLSLGSGVESLLPATRRWKYPTAAVREGSLLSKGRGEHERCCRHCRARPATEFIAEIGDHLWTGGTRQQFGISQGFGHVRGSEPLALGDQLAFNEGERGTQTAEGSCTDLEKDFSEHQQSQARGKLTEWLHGTPLFL
jgi:uncharacterized protein